MIHIISYIIIIGKSNNEVQAFNANQTLIFCLHCLHEQKITDFPLDCPKSLEMFGYTYLTPRKGVMISMYLRKKNICAIFCQQRLQNLAETVRYSANKWPLHVQTLGPFYSWSSTGNPIEWIIKKLKKLHHVQGWFQVLSIIGPLMVFAEPIQASHNLQGILMGVVWE